MNSLNFFGENNIKKTQVSGLKFELSFFEVNNLVTHSPKLLLKTKFINNFNISSPII